MGESVRLSRITVALGCAAFVGAMAIGFMWAVRLPASDSAGYGYDERLEVQSSSWLAEKVTVHCADKNGSVTAERDIDHQKFGALPEIGRPAF
jgi:hypothetical protein